MNNQKIDNVRKALAGMMTSLRIEQARICDCTFFTGGRRIAISQLLSLINTVQMRIDEKNPVMTLYRLIDQITAKGLSEKFHQHRNPLTSLFSDAQPKGAALFDKMVADLKSLKDDPEKVINAIARVGATTN